MRGQVDRAGFLRRPAVPSRARDITPWRAGEYGSCGVGEELAVEGVGDPALETTQRFELGLAGGLLAPVVGPAVGVEADLADRGDVDHVVHPSVPGSGEPVAVLLAGGGVQGCGAGPGGEPVAVGASGAVADVG